MKRIPAINCSPRTGWNTAALVREAAGTESRETLFPQDKKKAFALGVEMAQGAWEE